MRRKKYPLKFAHVIDESPNSFAINCESGDVYLNNNMLSIKHLPLTIDKKPRIDRITSLRFMLMGSGLNFVSNLTYYDTNTYKVLSHTTNTILRKIQYDRMIQANKGGSRKTKTEK
jgi:hypothetical protein